MPNQGQTHCNSVVGSQAANRNVQWLAEDKLTSPSSHIPLDRLKGNLQAAVDECRTLGNSVIVCPYLDASVRRLARADAITPPPLSERIQQMIPGAELEVIPGAGHMSNMERPELFNRAVARFLAHRV